MERGLRSKTTVIDDKCNLSEKELNGCIAPLKGKSVFQVTNHRKTKDVFMLVCDDDGITENLCNLLSDFFVEYNGSIYIDKDVDEL